MKTCFIEQTINRNLVKKMRKASPTVPIIELGITIPKFIYQTFPTKQLPDELKQNVEHLKAQNTSWTHILYDDEDIRDFIEVEYGSDMLASFEAISPLYGAARADLFRYLLLYKRGGVYLDIKSGLKYPLDHALRPDDKVILSQWNHEANADRNRFGMHAEISLPGGELQQWQIMTVSGHPFLRSVIEQVTSNISNYNPWKVGTGGVGVYRVTGPIAYTTAIEPLLSFYKHRLVKDSDFGLIYSAIPSSHKKMFKGHYLMRTDPVIRQTGLAQISGGIYSTVRRLKRVIKPG